MPRSPRPQLQRWASCPLHSGVGLNRTALQWIPQIREFGVLSLGALLARNSSGSGKNLLSGGDPETNARPCTPQARPPSQPSRRSHPDIQVRDAAASRQRLPRACHQGWAPSECIASPSGHSRLHATSSPESKFSGRPGLGVTAGPDYGDPGLAQRGPPSPATG